MLPNKPTPRYQRDEIDKHLAGLAADATIRRVVGSAAVQQKLTAFEAADDDAIAQQGHFKRSGRFALGATTIGTVVGALLLLPIDPMIAGRPRIVIGLLQTLALIVTFLAIWMIGKRKYVDRWMESRADAERQRGEIFWEILESQPADGEPAEALTAQKFALINASHVNDQLRFYDKAHNRHLEATKSKAPFRRAGYVLTVVAIALGGVAIVQLLIAWSVAVPDFLREIARWGLTADTNRWQLGLGTIASSLLAHGSARTMMDQDERNAALYKRTAAKLRDVLAAHDAAACARDRGALRAWFRDVRRVMEEEHIAWVLSRPGKDPLPHSEPPV